MTLVLTDVTQCRNTAQCFMTDPGGNPMSDDIDSHIVNFKEMTVAFIQAFAVGADATDYNKPCIRSGGFVDVDVQI